MSIFEQVMRYFGFGKYSKWEKGKLRSLIGKPNNEEVYAALFPGKMKDVELALTRFCEAMDIPTSQMYLIKPTDKMMSVYDQVKISESMDDLEIERLFLTVEAELKIDPEKNLNKVSTVSDWISLWIRHGSMKDQ